VAEREREKERESRQDAQDDPLHQTEHAWSSPTVTNANAFHAKVHIRLLGNSLLTGLILNLMGTFCRQAALSSASLFLNEVRL